MADGVRSTSLPLPLRQAHFNLSPSLSRMKTVQWVGVHGPPESLCARVLQSFFPSFYAPPAGQAPFLSYCRSWKYVRVDFSLCGLMTENSRCFRTDATPFALMWLLPPFGCRYLGCAGGNAPAALHVRHAVGGERQQHDKSTCGVYPSSPSSLKLLPCVCGLLPFFVGIVKSSIRRQCRELKGKRAV